MNYPEMDPTVVKRKIDAGEVHLESVAKLYRKQHNRGKYFFHETRLARNLGTIRQFSDCGSCQVSMLPKRINACTASRLGATPQSLRCLR